MADVSRKSLDIVVLVHIRTFRLYGFERGNELFSYLNQDVEISFPRFPGDSFSRGENSSERGLVSVDGKPSFVSIPFSSSSLKSAAFSAIVSIAI